MFNTSEYIHILLCNMKLLMSRDVHIENESSKVDIVFEGGLPVLIEMMHSADVETAHQGTGVVANLGEVVENQGKMVESGENQRPR